ncbi:MAG: helix-turn-helix domain-containing protein [Cypionkella sp.]
MLFIRQDTRSSRASRPVPRAADSLRPSVADCLFGAKAILDHDPDRAHDLLDRLAVLLADPALAKAEEACLVQPVEVCEAAPGGLARWQLRKVLSHIELNLSQAIYVEALAALVHLSSGYFSRAFKVSTGDTPHNYIIRQRVRRAQMLMLSTPAPLSEIAVICGFTDQAHMTRYFGRHVDRTPFVWRRAFKAA